MNMDMLHDTITYLQTRGVDYPICEVLVGIILPHAQHNHWTCHSLLMSATQGGDGHVL